MKSEKNISSGAETSLESLKVKNSYHHIPRAERYAIGKQMRKACPRSSHDSWKVPDNRPDPVDLIIESDQGRIPNLVPLRHARMAISPFTFYRGSALIMASDLSHTPNTGIYVQACGDAHLSNFGGFATPERNVIFSINDLDETLPAPWEWDVKRLASSFAVACRNNGLNDSFAKEAASQCARSYREHMHEFSEMRMMELWHYSLVAEMLLSRLKDPNIRLRLTKRLENERNRSVAEEIFPKITKGAGELNFIKDQLPAIFHMEGQSPGQIAREIMIAYNLYRRSLSPAYSLLLDRFEIKDAAIKVVGVGSVGTSCWVLLFMTGDGERFFLQVKEARESVLERYTGKSAYPHHGQRVINGYRIMQPFSDPFLGWTTGKQGRNFYLRQLRDIKISIRVETFGKTEMLIYADWCGQALALSHARSGDAALLCGYMGNSDVFDEAVAGFSMAYADQNQKDYDRFINSIKDGKVEVTNI